MKRDLRLMASLVLVVLFPLALLGQDLKKRHDEVIYPVVRVRAGNAGGSGTVVYSKKDMMGKWRTYVMTNHHVIESLVEVKEQWDPVLKKQIKQEVTKTASVEFFKYNNLSHTVGSFAVEADIATYDVPQDWALLELRDHENGAQSVAHLFPSDSIPKEIHVMDETYAVGASLGHPPIATNGHISFMDDEIDNFKYWMSTAQTIFGNSGGAVFRYSKERAKYEFIGIPSRISVASLGFLGADAITHMGYFIPIDRIYNLLESHIFQFIYDPTTTVEACEKLRRDKRERARLSQAG